MTKRGEVPLVETMVGRTIVRVGHSDTMGLRLWLDDGRVLEISGACYHDDGYVDESVNLAEIELRDVYPCLACGESHQELTVHRTARTGYGKAYCPTHEGRARTRLAWKSKPT